MWNRPRAKRDHTATLEQTEAWRKLKSGDIIVVRLRTGSMQRFVVKQPPAELKPEPGIVYAVKMGAGNTPYRRIAAYELVLE